MFSETDEKIYAVVAECGVGKPVNFHRTFRKHAGLTPRQFRQQHEAT